MASPNTYTNVNALLERIQAHMTANGNHENTGDRTQELLMEMVLSILAILAGVPPEVLNGFPAWDDEVIYEGGSETVVRHNGKLYLFVSGADSEAQEPGTFTLVWKEMSALQLAHFRNQDLFLDFGGSYQVSAQELYEHIHGTGGDIPTLAQVLVAGSITGPTSITMSPGRQVVFLQDSGARLSVGLNQTLTDDCVLNFQAKSGTVALTSDITIAIAPVVTSVTNEVTARTAADAALQAQIDALSAAIANGIKAPKPFAPESDFPLTYGGEAIQTGACFQLIVPPGETRTMGIHDDSWTVSNGDLLIALEDAPGQDSRLWIVQEANKEQASRDVGGWIKLAAQEEVTDPATGNFVDAVVPGDLWLALWALLSTAEYRASVQNVQLSLLEAGPATEIVGTDLLRQALAKLQAQVTGRLRKDQGLADLADPKGGRANLKLDELRTFSNANSTADKRATLQAGTLTAVRTVDLPLASTCNPGEYRIIGDQSGSTSLTNWIEVRPSGSDTINGGTTPIRLSHAFANVRVYTDGVSKWTYDPRQLLEASAVGMNFLRQPSVEEMCTFLGVTTGADVDARFTALIGAAPLALDTLVELAAALGGDSNFSATVTTALAARMQKSANLSDVVDREVALLNLTKRVEKYYPGTTATASTSLVDLPDLGVAVAQAGVYEYECQLVVSSDNAAGTINASVNGPTGGTPMMRRDMTVTDSTVSNLPIHAHNAGTASPVLGTANAKRLVRMVGTYLGSPSTNGTLVPRVASPSGHMLSIHNGWVKLRKLN